MQTEEDWGDISPNPDYHFSLKIIEQPINYDCYFNVREYFGTYDKLLFAVNFNSSHILEQHMYKGRNELLVDSMINGRNPKSVFSETFNEKLVLSFVEETLLNPNICVEYEASYVVKIRKR